MSFYGNIKRVNSSPYVFDKIYPNRVAMEAATNSDKVYVGRYVLIKYTVKDELDNSSNETYFTKYVEDTQNPGAKKVYTGYQFNADKDIAVYHDTYDATVWQKVYLNTNGGSEKYILVAELNAAVPRLDFDVISPKTTDGTIETWNEPSIDPSASSEDSYVFTTPDILHLDVGEMNEDFYAKGLIDPKIRRRMTENGECVDSNYGSDSFISHADMLSPAHNFMEWVNQTKNNNGEYEILPNGTPGNIDGKQLNTELYAFGQVISDLYDALYGVPSSGVGPRPYYTDDLSSVLSNYDKGLIGILSSISSEIKGEGSEDSGGRALAPGNYYYFTTKWCDASEDPDSFIENIPKVIGSSSELGAQKAHFKITGLELSSQA